MKRTMQAILSLSYMFSAISVPVQAATILYDDFSDGSVIDGSPISWSISPFQGGGSMQVENGDLILYPTERKMVVIPDIGFLERNVSVRMQIRVLGYQAGGYAVQLPYGDDEPGLAYLAGVGLYPPGNAYYLASTYPDPDAFTQIDGLTGFDPTIEDIVMQFDVIGSTLTYWAWPASGRLPTEPLAIVTDSVITEGKVAVEFLTPSRVWNPDDPTLRSLAVRYFQVSDTHIPIPEPSSLLLTGFAGLIYCSFRRR